MEKEQQNRLDRIDYSQILHMIRLGPMEALVMTIADKPFAAFIWKQAPYNNIPTFKPPGD